MAAPSRPDIEPSKEQIEEFKTAYGPDLRAVVFPMGDHHITVVVRPPEGREYKCFQDTAREDTQRSSALQTLGRDCAVFPSAEDLNDLAKKKPAALGKVGLTALELAGNSEEVAVKKL